MRGRRGNRRGMRKRWKASCRMKCRAETRKLRRQKTNEGRTKRKKVDRNEKMVEGRFT